jgi:hypothetical protein
MKETFKWNGIDISDPTLDDTGKFPVNPVLFYGEAYCDFMIENHTEIFNKQLEPLGLKVNIFQTSEFYGEDEEEIDEEDPYFKMPMYEAYIIDSDEEEIENTTTGRYCDISSVIDEIKGFVDELFQKNQTVDATITQKGVLFAKDESESEDPENNQNNLLRR